MNRTGALRGLLGVVMASSLAMAGPAVASERTIADQTVRLTPDAVLATTSCTPGAHACPIRIHFTAGSFSGQAHSRLTGIRSQRWFVVHARAGQTMVIIVQGHGATRGAVYFPNGASRGAPGGRIFDASVPATGDYRIRVTESTMGEAWSGRIDVVALIY